MEKRILIETDELVTEFTEHFNNSNNHRILFTAPYGSGKSTFLKNFFGQATGYFTINLFPVNYAVSANEDVFELIKFDIILQLLENYLEQIKLKKEEFSLLLRSQLFIQERLKFMPLFSALLGMVGKVGQSAVGLIDAAKKVHAEFKDFSKEIEFNEQKEIENYIYAVGKKRGSIYEMDGISSLIADFIQRIKHSITSGSKYESVLILDDLDRLDPDHLFRLLNIFSAHQVDERDNKFGFDKIIFVGDIENVRKIFHHKYGQGVDFAGYIDKFYSLSPFDFDNRRFLREKLEKVLLSINFDDQLKQLFPQVNSDFLSMLKGVINAFIDARLINLRMLLDYPLFKMPQAMFAKNKNNIYSTTDTPIVALFHFLKNFYGSFEILRNNINFLVHNVDAITYTSNINTYVHFLESNSALVLIGYCLPIIHSNETSQFRRDEERHFFFSEKYKCTLHFQNGSAAFGRIYRFLEATVMLNEQEVATKLNPFQLMLDAFDDCWKLKALA